MSNSKSLYLPGLNGIRAIAAVSVLVAHTNSSLSEFNIPNFSMFSTAQGKPSHWWFAEHAVTMFFVLSGFLITYLLLIERKTTRTIKVKNFYIRRLLRIWPIYYLYIILAFLAVNFYLDFFNSNAYFYLFLMANVPFALGTGIPILGHLWSISVEEQFYLFWPWLFKKTDLKKLKIIIIIFIIAQFIMRVFLWKFHPGSFAATLSSVTRFDCMMIGAFFAILSLEKSFIIRYINSRIVQISAWLMLVVIMGINLNRFNDLLVIYLVCLVTSFIIIGQIGVKNRIVNLDNFVFEQIGKLSYGIYVYHPLIIYLFYKTGALDSISNIYLKIFTVFIVIIISTLIISYVSYNYFEKSFLRYKDRFMIVKSRNYK